MMARPANRIPINKPSITRLEIDYVNDAIRHGWGDKCYEYIKRFEKSFAVYLGTNHALATSSCTGAIHLALMAMGIKAGDEVILPDITWIASVEPVLYIGAKPIFVDVLEDSWCIDPEIIEKAPDVLNVPVPPEAQVMFELPLPVIVPIDTDAAATPPVPFKVTVWLLAVVLAVKLKAPVTVKVLPVLTDMPSAEVGLAMATVFTVEFAFMTGVEPLTMVTSSPEPTPFERQV